MITHEQTSPVIKCAVYPYTLRQLSKLYRVSEKTFRKWLVPFKDLIGAKTGSYYTIAQVEKIFDKLGIPGTYTEE
jgi:hypothetical protein